MSDIPNLSYIDKLASGDKEFHDSFLKSFASEMDLDSKAYIQNLQESNFQIAADMVHKIRNKLGILSMQKSFDMTYTYEEELRLENVELHDAFMDALNQVQKFLKAVL